MKSLENNFKNNHEKNRIEINDIESFLDKNFNKIFGIVDIFRHGHTRYTGKFPDITEEGMAALEKTADKVLHNIYLYDKLAKERTANTEQSLLYLTSEAVRANGSLDRVKNKIDKNISNVNVRIDDISPRKDNLPEEKHRIRKSIRSLYKIDGEDEKMDQLFLEWSKADDMDHWNEDIETQRNSDYVYINQGDAHGNVLETPKKVEERVFADLGRSYKSMYRYRKKFDSVPHAIIATHFETIAPLLIKGFGASTDRDKLELPERAENVSLYFLESDNPDIAKIVINFRDKSVEANFNLKTFQFE